MGRAVVGFCPHLRGRRRLRRVTKDEVAEVLILHGRQLSCVYTLLASAEKEWKLEGTYKALGASNMQTVGVAILTAAPQGCTQEAGSGEESGR